MSDDTQVGSTVQAIYRHNMEVVIKCWEQRITAASLDITPVVTEEELAQFRS
jgi:hypothetical protein